ncbi:membrane protein [Burkholderia pseudomallei]|nr:membrane protein [Burkholderia pseudomallei]
MQGTVSLWPLIGVAVIVVGFALRFNPMLIVATAAIVTAASAHFPPERILAAIGAGFLKTRNIPLIILLPLAVIGLLERHGLRERAQAWIASIRAATAGRLLILYLLVRELTAAVGLTGLGGHPQMVRPLIAPMAEGATENRFGPLPDAIRHRLRAYAAATDNVGLFFGEDIFVAFGAIVLMVTFLKEAGIAVEPMRVALWGIPTAVSAFVIHGARLWLLDRRLERELRASAAPHAASSGANAAADNGGRA